MINIFKKWLNLRCNQKKERIKSRSFKKGTTEKEKIVRDFLDQLIHRAGLDLSFDIQTRGEKLMLEFKGKDQFLLIEKDGKLLSAFQLFLKRVLQHHDFDFKNQVFLDCKDFRKKSDQNLEALVKKLKGIALHKGGPVYLKALSPRDRKLVHQIIAEDEKVKSTSVGEGLYKKIKISPVTRTNETRKSRKENDEAFSGENFL